MQTKCFQTGERLLFAPISPPRTQAAMIPTDEDWCRVLAVTAREPIRNRLMLAMSYDAGLRREELCSLETGDIDPSRRVIRIRAETTKNRRARVLPYSAITGELFGLYLQKRRTVSVSRGRLFCQSREGTLVNRYRFGVGRRSFAPLQYVRMRTGSQRILCAISALRTLRALIGIFTRSPPLRATETSKPP